MQAPRPHWFIQEQCDGSGKIICEPNGDHGFIRQPTTAVYVKTVVDEQNSCDNCCLCNGEFDGYGRWNVYQCSNESAFYVCPDSDCCHFMYKGVEALDYKQLFMQYADSDVWYMLDGTHSATD
jgi:hypothetical protein